MKVGIIVFPGSNCDTDCAHAVRAVTGEAAEFVWHKETSLKKFDLIILPGGFSYGDYLRCGAIAKFSPIMQEVRRHADSGRLVLGICNGFQILTEAGLLPGALMRNRRLKFICDTVTLKLATTDTPFTSKGRKGAPCRMPIAHMEGNYFVDAGSLKKMEENGQIVFQYADESGKITDSANPNGSLRNIAGICNEKRNVLGMMPHPERASEAVLGGDGGRFVF